MRIRAAVAPGCVVGTSRSPRSDRSASGKQNSCEPLAGTYDTPRRFCDVDNFRDCLRLSRVPCVERRRCCGAHSKPKNAYLFSCAILFAAVHPRDLFRVCVPPTVAAPRAEGGDRCWHASARGPRSGRLTRMTHAVAKHSAASATSCWRRSYDPVSANASRKTLIAWLFFFLSTSVNRVGSRRANTCRRRSSARERKDPPAQGTPASVL